MPADHRATLAKIKRFDQLVAYLRDEMGWPIGTDDFEDITFTYTAEELGIDAENAAKIDEIRRLRPLSVRQPWGIFFVKFEPRRLPVVALRRILSQVVLKKRASAKAAERTAWEVDDLLFVSNYGEGDERRISFAHFSQAETKKDLPTLRVLGWDNLDTALHLDAVARELTDHLVWPDDEQDVEGWRARWSSAFTLRHREVITTSRDLSIRLAELARAIRDRIRTALAIETERGPLTKLMKAFQQALVHDLDAAGFADMYAQTITYGLLSSRIANPKADTADHLPAQIPVTNPFLKELMETFLKVGGRRGKAGGPGIDFDELGVSEVVELLDDANMEAVVRDFGDKNPQEDPVIHFYELFLKEYDAKKRMQRGVFYTPRPVVSYIVRSVDDLLRTEFGLEDGLADMTAWAEMAGRHKDLKIPEGVPPEQDFVQILDPACGTGTFLVEVIDTIYKTLRAKWEKEADGPLLAEVPRRWNEYVPKHLLPRLHGYELLMAPYAIAHLKIGLKLHETGYRFGSDERARIYLTNALEPARPFQMSFEIPALAHEAEAVNEIKRKKRFTVVIGNPPYSISSWNTGAWITNLVEDYKRTVRSEESQIQALSNDYIKFLRFGQWMLEESQVGLIGMITGHGYLQGTQPRDLRRSLGRTFEKFYCLDLHGSTRRSGTEATDDEPVFQIMTGVAIFVGFRNQLRTSGDSCLGLTLQTSLVGPLSKKFEALSNGTVRAQVKSSWHRPTAPYYRFAPPTTSDDVVSEYQSFYDLPACFGTGDRQTDKETYWATGFASQQDDLAISFTRDDIATKMMALAESRSFDQLRRDYRLCTTDQWNYSEAREFVRKGSWRPHVGKVVYRPFDRRWSVLHKHILTILRKQVMSQFGGAEKNIGLISSRAVNDLTFAHCFVADGPVDKIFISSKTSTNAYVFPLFFKDEDLYGKQRRPNFSQPFIDALGKSLCVETRDEGAGLPTGVTAEEVFYYLYSILHSPKYRARYAEFLKIDFPRIPLPRGLDNFRELASLGSDLVTLHLLESPKLDQSITKWVGGKNPDVEKVTYSDETVWIDKAKTEGFRGVPEAVWNFHIGGYQVCEKWLKDRKGRKLSKDDLSHYQKIVVALSETIRIMKEIDVVIEKHGGWPNAFAVQTAKAVLRPAGGAEIIALDDYRVQKEKFKTLLPLYSLKAAAGYFGNGELVEPDGWVDASSIGTLDDRMFAARAVGRSMEPVIHDGDLLVFRRDPAGTRQGKIVLAMHRDPIDPETGCSCTVKKYSSEKVPDPDTEWRHSKIVLSPLNNEFHPIAISEEKAGEFKVVAEFVEVLRP